MAEIEEVVLIRVDNGEAVKNVADLRDNIKQLKQSLEQTEIGTKEYQRTLQELKVNQNALKDAMYASSASMDDLTSAANGVGQSYNALVHRMAEVKAELRSTDVSTQAGKKRFAELAAEVNKVNDQLKEMDAMQGNYQRNVGNYQSALSGLSNILMSLPPTLGSVKEQVGKVGQSMALVGKQPILGIIGLLAPIVIKITESLKDNDKALGAVRKAMTALEPVFQFLEAILDKIADALSSAVDWMVDLAGQSSGTFKTITTGAFGVGNAILQFILTPIRTTIEAVKGLGNVVKDVFTGQFAKVKEDAQAAIAGIGDAFKSGFAFKTNYEAGQVAGDAFLSGMKSRKKEAKDAGASVAQDYLSGITDEIGREIDKAADEVDKAIDRTIAAEEAAAEKALKAARDMEAIRLEGAETAARRRMEINALTEDDERKRAENAYQIQAEANQRRLSLLEEFRQAALDRGDVDTALQYEQQASDLRIKMQTAELAESKRLRAEDVKNAKESAAKRMEIMQSAAGALSGILGTMADIYENDTQASEAELRKAKNMRIAGATIDMLSGVVSAISQAMSLGPIVGPIVGAANSAAVIAAGVTNIAKIRAQSTSPDSAGSGAASAPAVVTPPAVSIPDVPQVRNVTTASEEDRLNRMAGDQRVYILQSDIEASGDYARTAVAEASF